MGIGLEAGATLKASGEVFKGLVNRVMKYKHYPKGRKEPLKAFTYTKTFVFRDIILVAVQNKSRLWAR